MPTANGWALYETGSFKRQKAKLDALVTARKSRDPEQWAGSADSKLAQAIEHLTLNVIPADPGAKQFRQGDTLGAGRKHWFRAKFGQGRYRLFFQFNSTAKIIIYAWVNDAETLRSYGSKTDAYAVFAAMLATGNPPDTWGDLMNAVGAKVGVMELDAIGARPKDRGGKRKR